MNRRAKILYFCKQDGKGLEIGPSFNPVAPKSEGYKVDILDHASTDELKAKYAAHGVDLTKIEPVDFVWTGQPIDELIGQKELYDWIIISHVIEHVPDLIAFFRSCTTLLKPDGIISLAIPDKRYCFDYFRWPTSTGDVLQAWMEKRKRHSMGAVFDHLSLACGKGGQHAWGSMHCGEISLMHDFLQAATFLHGYETHNEYVDIHAWRFTPASFRLILYDLRRLDLLNLSEAGFFDTEGCEFFISLKRDTKTEKENDQIRLELCNQMVKEMAEPFIDQQRTHKKLIAKGYTILISGVHYVKQRFRSGGKRFWR